MKQIFTTITILPLFIVTMTHASGNNNTYTAGTIPDTTMKEIAYINMSTAQLQEEVEKRSINGNLSFDMGLELIRRWTNS